MKRCNLEGQRFGRLLVLRFSDDRSFRWVCQCDCGNICYADSYSLMIGKTQSCGCLKRENRFVDVKGQRFGKLVALDRLEKTCKTGAIWRWQCDCGRVVEVPLWDVKYGKWVCECHKEETAALAVKKFREKQDKIYVKRLKDTMNGKLMRNNTSGVPGVCWHVGFQRWYAYISFQKRRIPLGTYTLFNDAVNARKDAEDQYFGSYLKSIGEDS